MIIFIGFLIMVMLGILGITPFFSVPWWICWLIIGIVNMLYKSIRSKPVKEPDVLIPPRGLGRYVAGPNLDKIFPLNYHSPIEYDEDTFPLGKSHLVNSKHIIPRGLGSDVPNGGQSNSALLVLMKPIEAKIAKNEPLKSDDSYDEPQASYPIMEQ